MSVSAIKHITVALDDSPASEAAVSYACELAGAEAALSFCSVIAKSDRAREICEAAVDRARALGIEADHFESQLHPAEAVAACAEEHASKAIVVGSDVHKGFAHLRGSTGEDLMRIADRPVIFIRATDRYRGGDIAVAISGYDASHRVLDAAIAIAMTLDRELFILTEITLPQNVDYYAPGSNTDARVLEAAARASAAGIKSSTAVGDGVGSIPSALIELSKQRDCSMIVTGLHDHSGIAHVFKDSVAHQLVLDAHVPVTVVHHAQAT